MNYENSISIHPYNETEVEQQRHKSGIAPILNLIIDKILLSDRHSVLYVILVRRHLQKMTKGYGRSATIFSIETFQHSRIL